MPYRIVTTRLFSRIVRQGFTLIELLVVVSVISILASIAVPNYLEAQTRAKVARTKADMNSLRTAIECYKIDHNQYPVRQNKLSGRQVPDLGTRLQQMSVLTTPVSYMGHLPLDVFAQKFRHPNNVIDYWDPVQFSWFLNNRYWSFPGQLIDAGQAGWLLLSMGPDLILGQIGTVGGWPQLPIRQQGTMFFPYDPTNGTISSGNLYMGQLGGLDGTGNLIQERCYYNRPSY